MKKAKTRKPPKSIAETVPPDSLKPHPRNYRQHPDDQLSHIVASIKEHGIYRNIVVAKDSVILAGHGVVEAAKKAGIKKVPIIRLGVKSTDSRAIKLMAGDNEIGRLAEVNDRALTDLLKELKDADDEALLGTGFDDKMLAALAFVTRPESEIKDADEAAEWVGMPSYDWGSGKIQLIITFESKEDREAFVVEKLQPGNMTKKAQDSLTWSARWPATQDEDAFSLRFEAGGKER